jgi:glycosyltransferase involved in cell wall biosynthesis
MSAITDWLLPPRGEEIVRRRDHRNRMPIDETRFSMPHASPEVGSRLASARAGFRVLARHLRYAYRDPRKLAWIVRRVVEIVFTGRLSGVLERHRAVGDSALQYRRWMQEEAAMSSSRREALLREAKTWDANAPRFSILMPLFSPPRQFLRLAIQAVLEQSYAGWELCIVDDGSPDKVHLEWLQAVASADRRITIATREVNSGIAAATNDALSRATGDFVVFMDQDDLIAQDCLLEFAVAAVHSARVQAMFADEDRIDPSGSRSRPFFKPSLDREWLRTTNCVLHPLAVRTSLLRELGGIAAGFEGAQDWELTLRLTERLSSEQVVHIPRVLYHWREHRGSTAAAVYEKPAVVASQQRVLETFHARRGESVTLEQFGGAWRIRRALPATAPLVSMVVPTRDGAALMRRLVVGLRKRTRYPNWECVVIDNGSTQAKTLALLDELRRDPAFRVVRDDGDFNYARLCNTGVAASQGDIVVLLNNDVEPMSDDWLSELVVNAVRPEIGMVGAMLYYPDHTIQHAGVVLWLNGVADRPYLGVPRGFAGVDNRLIAVHTVTAVITACAAVRRTVYREVGGMDEQLPIACNDLDLCLKIAEAGYRNIITPFAELYHRESASRGYHYRTAEAMQETLDETLFRKRWAARWPSDPMYNPNFTLNGPGFCIAHPGV